MKKALSAFAILALLAACSSEPSPTAKLEYTLPSKIVLDVQHISFADNSPPPGMDSPYNAHRLEPTIAQAIRQWAADRLQAGGTNGQAVVVVKDASLTTQTLPMSQNWKDSWFKRQQAHKYTGRAAVQIEIRVRNGYAVATAEASRSVTLPEDPAAAERQDAYITLLNGLMRDLGQNLEASIRQHMQSYILPAMAMSAAPRS
ncbi:MAG: hypothetical protein SFW62_09355 [Alphaproteobacteria bacterium]|nr:hypothetical protein [Alphaproteobacteria bacterium]